MKSMKPISEMRKQIKSLFRHLSKTVSEAVKFIDEGFPTIDDLWRKRKGGGSGEFNGHEFWGVIES